ncbi:heat shock protein (Hsp90-family) [Escherichia coli]|uniref:Heat shock protein (Hsp90-family) n=3 Tax=Escherichia coli TaxID=562 RepID=A0A376HNN7_ECOLX|nr:ATP-binding protein [Escherichia coli]EHU06610.1 histidine kinase-, DNA gyrase B-, and HSP90-like ATPase family protein [Escherichia coli DEC1B]EHU22410.1 histidine kinase-, DNA gyrase B-, and HSP90-like ATPase family protein [Escherichia coli DEC2A]EHU36683.1 histidine kinase-, DNA gyrase B-, and HSP90-like ATPase family protein [Escherichia coli DEC2C]EHU50085.1 histidine kinase-, DNA gyrase B-, and HSP90-like ATPase family protein [Escherichia coli DEC2E]EFA4418850.1 molecular chaperone 
MSTLQLPGSSYSTEVNLNGLIEVLSKHLYSTPVVAVRELVQNGHDAIVRRRIEQPDAPKDNQIRVVADVAKSTITITDTGAGLTESEIHGFLATVGVGYTRMLRQQDDNTGLIGMFGLGFLSAFVLAKEVTVLTTSWQTPDQSWKYHSTDGQKYTVTPHQSSETGTQVILTLKEEYSHLASNNLLNRVLSRYCVLLHEPVYVGDASEPVNKLQPPWREVAPEGVTIHRALVQRKNLAFAAQFESSFEPICTIPVVPAGMSDAVGILWIQDGATYGTSDNRNLSLFLRGMLLDDEARELLPPWAGFIGGVIESSKLTPTASREDLQRDATWVAVQEALKEALISGLSDLAQNQPEIWRRVLMRHNEALLGAALCDDRLFDLLKDRLQVPTSKGALLAKDLRVNNSIHILLSRDGGFEEMLFHILQRPVARGDRYAVVPFLRRWALLYHCRIVEVGTQTGNEQLFSLAELPKEQVAYLEEHLCDGEQLIISRFEPAVLPLVVTPDREAELKQILEQDDADKRISTAALMLARQFTSQIQKSKTSSLYINLNNPCVMQLVTALQHHQQPAAALRLLKSLKVILCSSGNKEQQWDLHQALEDFTQVIPVLINQGK